jgi:hypothetical protein
MVEHPPHVPLPETGAKDNPGRLTKEIGLSKFLKRDLALPLYLGTPALVSHVCGRGGEDLHSSFKIWHRRSVP